MGVYLASDNDNSESVARVWSHKYDDHSYQPQVMQYVMAGVTTVVVDIIVMIGYATLATRIAGFIKGGRQMKAINRVFGSMFMLIGALLAGAHQA